MVIGRPIEKTMKTERSDISSSRIPEVKWREYWRVLIIHKWVVMLGIVIILAASVVYLKFTVPEYEAEAILMEEESINPGELFSRGGSSGFYPWQDNSVQITKQQMILTSEDTLAEISSHIESAGQVIITPQEAKRISLSAPIKGSTEMLIITATADQPDKAAILANTAAEVYISRTLESRARSVSRLGDFLEEQMLLVDGKLRQSEEALNSFKEQEGIVGMGSQGEGSAGLLGQLGDLYAGLSKIQNQRELAAAKLAATRALLDEKKQEASSIGSNRLTSQIDSLQPLISNWQVELVILRQTLMDKDRDVINLKEKISSAQSQLDELFQELKEHGVSVDPLSEWQRLVTEAVQLKIQVKGLEQNENSLADRIAKFKEEHPQLISKEVELTRLERTARIHEQTYMLLTDKYEEMRMAKQVKMGGMSIFTRATEPEFPVKPNKRLVLTLGALMGIIAGVGAAYFLEYVDDSLKLERDVERTMDVPVVGTIPMIRVTKSELKAAEDKLALAGNLVSDKSGGNLPAPSKARKRGKKHQRSLVDLLYRTVSTLEPKSPVAESYRSLWTNIQFAKVDRDIKTILVTSSGPGEGKTLTAANLAITIARMGVKTLLIDTDMRRPRLHNIFGHDKKPGLSDLLVGKNGKPQIQLGDSAENPSGNLEDNDFDLSHCIRETETENLYLLPSGTRPPNPAELLSSQRKKQLVEDLKSRFDLLVFDSPPLIPVTDAAILASEVADICLLVVKSGETKREMAQRAQELLGRVDADLFGVVLNMVDYVKRYGSYYYYYHYHYYYSEDDEEDDE